MCQTECFQLEETLRGIHKNVENDDLNHLLLEDENAELNSFRNLNKLFLFRLSHAGIINMDFMLTNR